MQIYIFCSHNCLIFLILLTVLSLFFPVMFSKLHPQTLYQSCICLDAVVHIFSDS